MKNKRNTIASIIAALSPIAPLSLLLPAGEIAAGAMIVAALAGLGYIELRQGAAAHMPRRQSKGPIEFYRHSKTEA